MQGELCHGWILSLDWELEYSPLCLRGADVSSVLKSLNFLSIGQSDGHIVISFCYVFVDVLDRGDNLDNFDVDMAVVFER